MRFGVRTTGLITVDLGPVGLVVADAVTMLGAPFETADAADTADTADTADAADTADTSNWDPCSASRQRCVDRGRAQAGRGAVGLVHGQSAAGPSEGVGAGALDRRHDD